MESIRQIIDIFLQLLARFGDAAATRLSDLESWLREQLTELGVAPNLQTLVLVAVAALMLLASVRFCGGLIRVVAVVLLILVAVQILLPPAQPT